MGCDIHLWVEVQVSEGTWVLLTPSVTDGMLKTYGSIASSAGATEKKDALEALERLMEADNDEDLGRRDSRLWEHGGRDYTLFGYLANVRRSPEDGLAPIASRRGVPDDASTGYRRLVDDYGRDGHSHTWMTLPELAQHVDRYEGLQHLYDNVMQYTRGIHEENVRIVFFFDN